MAVIRDVLDAIMHRRSSAQPDSDLFSVVGSHARTAAEISAAVTPTNYVYAPDIFAYDIRRTGAALNGISDDLAAITKALSASNKVWIPDGVTVGISGPFTLAAGQTIIVDGTIKALAGYSQSYMCLINGAGASVLGSTGNGAFDGTNMPAPIGAWTGAGVGTARAAVGCCIFVNGSSGAGVIGNAQISRMTFKNFPSGPLLAFFADDMEVSLCSAINCQTYAGGETNGVFHSHNGSRIRYVANAITTFNWKGHYVANSNGSQMIGCVTNGGVAGHASHYLTGCADCSITGGTQTGGFGIKCFNNQRVTVNGFISYTSLGAGIYFQAVQGGTIEGCSVYNPTTYGIILEESGGTGDLRRIQVKNNRIEYSSAGANINQIGIRCAAVDGTNVVDDISISGNKIYQAYFGIHLPSGSNFSHSNIRITENDIDTPTQYGILAYVASADISRNRIKSAVAFESIYAACQSGVTGVYLKVNGNTSNNSNGSTNHYGIIPVGERVSLDILEFCDNTGDGGNTLMLADFSTNAADYVRTWKVCGNNGYNIAAATAMSIKMNATTTVQAAELLNNKLMTSAGALKNIVLTNHLQVTAQLFASTTYNNVNAVTLS